MIEVDNVVAVNRGSLLCTCDIYIAPWDLELCDVKVFEKGANRWIGMPSKEYTTAEGNKKYVELVNFRKESTKKRFRDQIMAVIDKYLLDNPTLKTEDLIKADADLPF